MIFSKGFFSGFINFFSSAIFRKTKRASNEIERPLSDVAISVLSLAEEPEREKFQHFCVKKSSNHKGQIFDILYFIKEKIA